MYAMHNPFYFSKVFASRVGRLSVVPVHYTVKKLWKSVPTNVVV
jgi:hypothetical protein